MKTNRFGKISLCLNVHADDDSFLGRWHKGEKDYKRNVSAFYAEGAWWAYHDDDRPLCGPFKTKAQAFASDREYAPVHIREIQPALSLVPA